MNFQCPFLHLDLACVTGIQRRGSKGRSACACVCAYACACACVCGEGFFEMNSLSPFPWCVVGFRVLNCICLCLQNVKFPSECHLPPKSFFYSVMNIHYVNFSSH